MQNPKFKIYRSSAGSGKTFTLTKEYLKLVLATPALPNFDKFYFASILAVTFTNDAAKEMKERMMSNLAKLKDLPKDSSDFLLQILQDEINEEYPALSLSKADLILRANRIYDTILHNYSDFSVSTIDAFNNKIVRSFTKDLDLPYNYEIELDTSETLNDAVELFLARAGQKDHQDLSDTLLEFARRNAEESRNWNIETSLKTFGINLFIEENYALIQNLQDLSKTDFKQIRQKLFAYQKNLLNKITEKAQEIINKIQEKGIGEKDFYYGNTGIYGYFNRTRDNKKFDITPNDNSYIRKTMSEDKWTGGKANNFAMSQIDLIKEDMREAFFWIEDLKAKEQSNYLIVKNLLPNIYLLSTINELDKVVRTMMTEKNKVHISDFNRKINKIVESEPMPYLYERLGERYRHVLIDEFQDTSQMQWHNLIPLMTNALSFDRLSMIVGDAKQAIYRWRGGNSELLVRLPEVPTLSEDSPLSLETDIFKQQVSSINLSKNWRSRENIIAFNNSLFEEIRAAFSQNYPDLAAYYQEIAQEKNHLTNGHVEINFVVGQPKEIYRRRTFEKVNSLIQELTTTKGYNYSDIAILCRNNDHATFLAQNLIANKIQVISNESLLLSYSRKVGIVIDFLRVMSQPMNPIKKAELLYFLFDHFNQELGANIAIDGNLHLEISQVARLNKISDLLRFIKDKTGIRLNFRALQYLSIYELAEEIIRLFLLNENDNEEIYLQKMLDVMLNFSLRRSNNLLDFVNYWDKKGKKVSVSTPKMGNAVQIMTIHKSKGLQFPVVIVPFADWEVTPKRGSMIWLDWSENELVSQLKTILLPVNKDLANTQFDTEHRNELQSVFIDSVNLLYVALTRPEEKLYIFGKGNEKPKNEPKGVNDLLEWYCMNLDLENLVFEEKEDVRKFVLYQDENPKNIKEKHGEFLVHQISQFLSTECRDKLRMRSENSRKEEKKINIADLYNARKKGVLTHYALEKIRYLDDVPSAVRALANEGYIRTQEQADLEEKLRNLLNLVELKPLFSHVPDRRIRNEREILVKKNEPNTKQTQTLRPDRLVIDTNKLTIIDYKTGSYSEDHQKQIDRYAEELKALGYQNIDKLLVYTEEMRVLRV